MVIYIYGYIYIYSGGEKVLKMSYVSIWPLWYCDISIKQSLCMLYRGRSRGRRMGPRV